MILILILILLATFPLLHLLPLLVIHDGSGGRRPLDHQTAGHSSKHSAAEGNLQVKGYRISFFGVGGRAGYKRNSFECVGCPWTMDYVGTMCFAIPNPPLPISIPTPPWMCAIASLDVLVSQMFSFLQRLVQKSPSNSQFQTLC